MTIYASVHGRLGQDPRTGETKAGKPMTRASIALDVAGFNADGDETLWVTILAFGAVADDLARAEQGQMLTAQGKMTRGRYTGKDNIERESWTLIPDAVLTAKSARPTGKKRVAA